MRSQSVKMLIKKIILLLVIIFNFKCSWAQNLALHKPYTLSVLPNYPYTAPSTDKTALTDGIYTKGYFWALPTTVGWVRSPVTITIDLGSLQPVGAVTFNSVRRSDQNVDFPQNIYVFLSRDNNLFNYIGDAAKDSNGKGPYLVRKFYLNNINEDARYVSLTVFPQGNNLFCDEIEVLKGIDQGRIKRQAQGISNINLAIDSLKNIDFLQKNIQHRASEVKLGPEDNGDKDEIVKLIEDQKNHNANELKDLSLKINQLHAKSIRQQFKTSFVVEKVNPWTTPNYLHYPSSFEKVINYQYLIPKKGAEYGAFLVTNIDSAAEEFTFSENSANLTSLQLFNASYVQSLDGTLVPDPLVPVKSGVVVQPGISQLFIFKIAGNNEGSFKYQLKVTSMNQTVQLNINVKIAKYNGFSSSNVLNAINWAYLSSPLLSDRKEQASIDLKNHGINTIVVPPQFLSKPGNNDFTALTNYLSNLKFAKNILISTGYSTPGNRDVDPKIKLLGDKWKSDFKEWYKNLLSTLKANGVNSTIYFYPYDEVTNADISQFAELVRWAKKEIPEMNVYATLSSKEAIDSMMPLIDIAQLQVPLTLQIPTGLPVHHRMVWIYSGSSPARQLSPYSFYRMMAWQAFENDITGIGFWNYAAEAAYKQKNLISDPLLEKSSSYSVIYDGNDQEILSSRRWEAFSLGLQDYSVLKIYAAKYGQENAKEIAMKVLNNPEDESLADSMVVQMLKRL